MARCKWWAAGPAAPPANPLQAGAVASSTASSAPGVPPATLQWAGIRASSTKVLVVSGVALPLDISMLGGLAACANTNRFAILVSRFLDATSAIDGGSYLSPWPQYTEESIFQTSRSLDDMSALHCAVSPRPCKPNLPGHLLGEEAVLATTVTPSCCNEVELQLNGMLEPFDGGAAGALKRWAMSCLNG